ncbi:MAG: hypothetical protein Q8N09_07075 [Thermodesulfovibrionia bacterium]|nr:hypothetical protein [Thermodesulfovibrionia bacterium]
MNIKIEKASGVIEDINPAKLRASLIRAGADREQAEDIIERILFEIGQYTSTKKIYKLAQKSISDNSTMHQVSGIL